MQRGREAGAGLAAGAALSTVWPQERDVTSWGTMKKNCRRAELHLPSPFWVGSSRKQFSGQHSWTG